MMGYYRMFIETMNYPVRLNLKYRLSTVSTSIILLAFLAVCSGLAYYLTAGGQVAQGDHLRRDSLIEQSGARSGTARSSVELALAYYLSGNATQAEKVLNTILELDENNGLANIYLGLVLADQGKFNPAIPLLEKGLKISPREEPLTYGYLGLCYYRTGNDEKATSLLEQACQAEPASPVNYYYLGLVQSRQGQKSKAELNLEKALRLAGNNYPEASTALKQLQARK